MKYPERTTKLLDLFRNNSCSGTFELERQRKNMATSFFLQGLMMGTMTLGFHHHPGICTKKETVLFAGFGAPPKKTPTPKKTYVKPGRKDLEAQWERFTQHSGPEASVWARVPESRDWLLVGAVNRRDGSDAFREAYSIQAALIAWCASELHYRIQFDETHAEFTSVPTSKFRRSILRSTSFFFFMTVS